MNNCNECRRPIAPEWRVCGWCGAAQVANAATVRGSFVKLANLVLAVQAFALTSGTLALAILWAMRGWSVERGQTLGIIWLGVMIALALMAWMSVNLSSQPADEQGAPQPQSY